MNLNNFENEVSETILARGLSYFNNHHVVELEETEHGQWEAEVEGNDTYFVSVSTDEDKIIDWECDCPFEGEICKHTVAVLYAIKEKGTKAPVGLEKESSKKNKNPKNNAEEIFKRVDKPALENFLVTSFSRYKGLKNDFMTHFSEYLSGDHEQKYRTLIQNIIRAGQDRHGFVDYHSARQVTLQLSNLLNKAYDLLEGKNLRESLAVCKIIIEEIPDLLESMDDSDGGGSTLSDFAFEIFHKIIVKAPPELRDNLFQYCSLEYMKEKYHSWDLGYELLDCIQTAVSTQKHEEQFLSLIDRRISTMQNNEDNFSEYSITSLIKRKIELLIKRGREDDAWKLIEANREYREIKMMLFDREMKKKNYDNALSICFEGRKSAEEKLAPGYKSDWDEKILDIYKLKGDKKGIRETAEVLLFESNYEIRYYKELKKCYERAEWAEVCESIINRIKENKIHSHYAADKLAKIFIEEKYLSRLLHLLKLNPTQIEFIDSYSKYLKDEYSSELVILYESGIKNYAVNTDRKYYEQVVLYLKKLQKIPGGEVKVDSLVKYFKIIYKNRRAMMEILNKNFK